MQKKYQIKTIEDIALQFIKHNVSKKKTIDLTSANDTIIDSKYYIKKYLNDNSINSSFAHNFQKLIPYDSKKTKNKKEKEKEKVKVIKFFRIPEKILGDDDELLLTTELYREQNATNIIRKNIQIQNSNGSKKPKLFNPNNIDKKLCFDLNYKNIIDCMEELYNPLIKKLESIFSLRTKADDILNHINFFSNNSSIFQMNKGNKNILEIFEELKIYEIIDFCLILFLVYIVKEIKVEYMDNINEEDIIQIYQNCYLVLKQIYEIILLMILFNSKNKDKSNGENNKYKSASIKAANEFYKGNEKPNNKEKIIEKINNNISSIAENIFESCIILYSNLIVFKKESGNLDEKDNDELILLEGCKINTKEKKFLSKEFNDQYLLYKIIYVYFTKDNYTEKNSLNEYNIIQKTEKDIEFLNISSKITTVFSSIKEIANLFLLYLSNIKILIEKSKVKAPFLPPMNTKKYIYTLVLDLDETLVHYAEEDEHAYVQVRPYADFFLNEMGKFFEIVIFTAAAEDYADLVLNELDKTNSISHKLYRKHTEQLNGIFIKDLKKLGRNLNKVIIVDNNKDNFSLQPENGLHISSFLGDQNDNELIELSKDLMKIIVSQKDDIRPIIKEIDDIMKRRYVKKNMILE